MAEVPDVSYVAVCDVSDDTTASAKQASFVARDGQGKGFPQDPGSQGYRRRAASATPDHWHAIATVLGCQAGKDVYVEKPLSHNVREGRLMVEAGASTTASCRPGCSIAPRRITRNRGDRPGRRIGDVHFVRVWNYGGASTQNGIRMRFHRRAWIGICISGLRQGSVQPSALQKTFRRFYDYAGGYITDFGCIGSIRYTRSCTMTARCRAIGMGGLYVRFGIEDTPDVIQVTYEYKNWMLSYEGLQLNNFGTGPAHAQRARSLQRLRVSWIARTARHSTAPKGRSSPIASAMSFSLAAEYGTTGKSVQGADRTDLHVANFIDCVRSRKRPVADVEIGHKTAITCHLGNISYRIGGLKEPLKSGAKSRSPTMSMRRSCCTGNPGKSGM